MHKGRAYALANQYRVYCGEYPYPLWAPAAWTISIATWAGTAAGSVPAAPLRLAATQVDASLRAVYECPLFPIGGGTFATLRLTVEITGLDHAEGRIEGDWGSHGSLPNVTDYHIPQPFSPYSSFFGHNSTPGEAYLRPTRLVWAAESY